MTAASHIIEPVMPLWKGQRPPGLCPNISPRGELHTWASGVREDTVMIKSIISPLQDVFLISLSPIRLKIQLAATQRLVCPCHSQVVGVHLLCPMWIRSFVTTHKKPSSPMRLRGANLALAKHPDDLQMANLLSLTINISVSYTGE